MEVHGETGDGPSFPEAVSFTWSMETSCTVPGAGKARHGHPPSAVEHVEAQETEDAPRSPANGRQVGYWNGSQERLKPDTNYFSMLLLSYFQSLKM